jgi:hypothetical protein
LLLTIAQNPEALVLKKRLHKFDDYFEDAPTDVGQTDRVSSENELWHLAGAFLNKGWKNSNVIKEDSVTWIFDTLVSHFHSVLGSRVGHGL